MTTSQQGGVATFFRAYEEATQTNKPDLFGKLYHESFLFGSPQGAQTLKLSDFLRFVPQRAEFAKNLGLAATRLVTVKDSPMDDKYTLAKVVWEMDVVRASGTTSITAEASYVLMKQEDGFRIVSQFDHQDLMERILSTQS